MLGIADMQERRKYRFYIGQYQFDVTKMVPVPTYQPSNCENSPKFVQPQKPEKSKKTIKPIKTVLSFGTVATNVPEKSEDSYITKTSMKVSKGFVTKLIKQNEIEWDPFVCKVEKRLFNETQKRWYLVLNDDQSSTKVIVATQCFHLFEKDIVKENDLIHVCHYAVTKLYDNKPKIMILTNFLKVREIS